jgi:hypothetical protein
MFPYGETKYDMGGLEHFPRLPESRRPWVQQVHERKEKRHQKTGIVQGCM